TQDASVDEAPPLSSQPAQEIVPAHPEIEEVEDESEAGAQAEAKLKFMVHQKPMRALLPIQGSRIRYSRVIGVCCFRIISSDIRADTARMNKRQWDMI
nr:hypothetical protein [Tanacetum cinerariifolium]